MFECREGESSLKDRQGAARLERRQGKTAGSPSKGRRGATWRRGYIVDNNYCLLALSHRQLLRLGLGARLCAAKYIGAGLEVRRLQDSCKGTAEAAADRNRARQLPLSHTIARPCAPDLESV